MEVEATGGGSARVDTEGKASVRGVTRKRQGSVCLDRGNRVAITRLGSG
jgi:hypothetical protein